MGTITWISECNNPQQQLGRTAEYLGHGDPGWQLVTTARYFLSLLGVAGNASPRFMRRIHIFSLPRAAADFLSIALQSSEYPLVLGEWAGLHLFLLLFVFNRYILLFNPPALIPTGDLPPLRRRSSVFLCVHAGMHTHAPTISTGLWPGLFCVDLPCCTLKVSRGTIADFIYLFSLSEFVPRILLQKWE